MNSRKRGAGVSQEFQITKQQKGTWKFNLTTSGREPRAEHSYVHRTKKKIKMLIEKG